MEPEPLVRMFLLSDRLHGLENDAWRGFFNTLGVVSGPFYLALENELMRAKSWHTSLAGTSAESWAQMLIERYETDVEWHRRRDEEENLHLR